MERRDWDQIASRLAMAWPDPPMTAERRQTYFEILEDLETDQVERAAERLLREGRERVPPPGVIRAVVTADLASAALVPALSSSVATPPPPAPAMKPSKNREMTADAGAQKAAPPAPFVPGLPVPEPVDDRQDHQSELGGLALAFAVLLAPVGLILGIVALRKYREPQFADDSAGRGLAIAAVVVSGVLCTVSLIGAAYLLAGGDANDEPIRNARALERSIAADGEFAGGTADAEGATCSTDDAVGRRYICLIDFGPGGTAYYDVVVDIGGDTWTASPS